MTEVNERLHKQYQEVAEIIEGEGLGYALVHGHLESSTDDEVLNEAIKQAQESIKTINRIIEPYSF